MIFNVFDPGLPRTIRAAIKRALRLDPMPDDLAAAVVAHGREFVNRALEAVEGVMRARRNHFKRQIIVVAANLTFSHRHIR